MNGGGFGKSTSKYMIQKKENIAIVLYLFQYKVFCVATLQSIRIYMYRINTQKGRFTWNRPYIIWATKPECTNLF